MYLLSIEDVYNDVVYVNLFYCGHALLHAACWSVSHCRRQQERPPLSTSFLWKLVARWPEEPSALSWVRTLCFSSGTSGVAAPMCHGPEQQQPWDACKQPVDFPKTGSTSPPKEQAVMLYCIAVHWQPFTILWLISGHQNEAEESLTQKSLHIPFHLLPSKKKNGLLLARMMLHTSRELNKLSESRRGCMTV